MGCLNALTLIEPCTTTITKPGHLRQYYKLSCKTFWINNCFYQKGQQASYLEVSWALFSYCLEEWNYKIVCVCLLLFFFLGEWGGKGDICVVFQQRNGSYS